MISLIACLTTRSVIGINNSLPWHIPNDLAHFKKLTTGKTVVMGRKTFESIGKPLPNRKNVVLTSNPDLVIDGCIVVNSIDGILELSNDEEVLIIGGSEIYKQFLPYADKMYLTIIYDDDIIGDSYFPDFDDYKWDRKIIKSHIFDDPSYVFWEYTKLQK